MNIYTKLREAVERSEAACYECEQAGTQGMCVSPYVDQRSLLAELKKLEEEDDTNRRAFAKEFDKKLKEECLDQGESETMPRSKCCGAPIVYCSGSKGEEVILCPKCMKTESSIVWGSKTGVTDCPACSGKGNIHKNCVMRGMPPLTKEEKGEEWWIDYLNERGLILRDKNGIAKHSDVEGFVAEARKKALEEVRDEIESLEEEKDGPVWRWRTFKAWLANKLDEMK
jgi:hypothetical protein